MKRAQSQSGFSLIELLIVVAIILIIAAIAIPNFIRARMSANEASAVSSMHAITSSEIGYAAAYPDIGYSNTLADLGGSGMGNPCTSTNACFLDSPLSTGTKSGYQFTYAPDGNTPSYAYTTHGDPVLYGFSGTMSYYADQSNVIRYNSNTAASINDPPLQ
jgi:prepilin-type N-terminal cleavage/methylation domain-containing protein